MIDLLLLAVGDGDRPRSSAPRTTRIATRDTRVPAPGLRDARMLRTSAGATMKVNANLGCVSPHFHAVRVYGTEATFVNGLPDGAAAPAGAQRARRPLPTRACAKSDLIDRVRGGDPHEDARAGRRGGRLRDAERLPRHRGARCRAGPGRTCAMSYPPRRMTTRAATRPIPFGRPMLGEEEREAVADVLEGTILTHGPRVQEFEAEFAAFTGAPHAVATATCMAALHLAYLALGLGPGDEVIVPAQTHVATAHAVELVGAQAGVRRLRPAHRQHGPRPARGADHAAHAGDRRSCTTSGCRSTWTACWRSPARHDLYVVEDCAVALGARVGDTHVGLLGDIGMLLVLSRQAHHHGRGRDGRHHARRPGRPGRQAARVRDRQERARRPPPYGRVRDRARRAQLPARRDRRGDGRASSSSGSRASSRIARAIYDALWRGPVARSTELRAGRLARRRRACARATTACVAVLRDDARRAREAIIDALKARGVGTSVYYPKSLPDTRYYARRYGYAPGRCPNATRISTRSIAFPVGPHVSDDDAQRIVETVKETIADVSELEGRRVALIGGAGFIGHNMALGCRRAARTSR